MNILIKQLQDTLPAGMSIPEPIKQLYYWIENNNLHKDNNEGRRIGYLYKLDTLNDSWTDDEREGGTIISFSKQYDDEVLKCWFGQEDDEIKSRLCVFARSGSDGSMCALWKDNNDEIKIVHMGSGSGSTLTCVLANNAVDFLRLLAIGYDEICWDEDFPYPPNKNNNEFCVKPNLAFQTWVKGTFNVNIPQNALEIVKYPTSMDDDASDDPFFNWCQKHIG